MPPARTPSLAVVQQRIFLVRGHKVMLDAHLAVLYGVETRVLVQAGQAQFEPVSTGFHVPFETIGSGEFEITKCDLKLPRRPPVLAVRLH